MVFRGHPRAPGAHLGVGLLEGLCQDGLLEAPDGQDSYRIQYGSGIDIYIYIIIIIIYIVI